jgi:quinol monooxygenase YgiN
MVIVAGHLVVDPAERAEYLAGCASVVESARTAEGCLDFAVSADVLDPGRVNVFERWTSRAAVEAFRGTGPSDEQATAILRGAVSEFDVAAERALF